MAGHIHLSLSTKLFYRFSITVKGYVLRDSSTTELNTAALSFLNPLLESRPPPFDLADIFSAWRDPRASVPAAEEGTMQIRLISIQLSVVQLKRNLDQAQVMEMIRSLASRM